MDNSAQVQLLRELDQVYKSNQKWNQLGNGKRFTIQSYQQIAASVNYQLTLATWDVAKQIRIISVECDLIRSRAATPTVVLNPQISIGYPTLVPITTEPEGLVTNVDAGLIPTYYFDFSKQNKIDVRESALVLEAGAQIEIIVSCRDEYAINDELRCTLSINYE